MSERHYQLRIPDEPIAKGRPRVYKGHGITPTRTRQAEQHIRQLFRQQYPRRQPFHTPVCVDLAFWMRKRGRPDIDNLIKLVSDALNTLAYDDDQQIVEIHATRILPDQWAPAKRGGWRQRRGGDPPTYRGKAYEPHTTVTVTPIPEWDPRKDHA